jgi:retinol-binding protein 3
MSGSPRSIVLILALCALAAGAVFGQAPAAPSATTRSATPTELAAPPAIDAAAKQAVVDEIAALFNKNYIFAEAAKKVEDAPRAKLKSGGFDQAPTAPAFAQAVAAVILDVTKDRHTGFAYNPAMAEDIRRLRGRSEEEARKVRERQLEEGRRDNFGFRKVERLAGNVGYLDFRVFESPSDAGATAVAAMSFLAYCDAIIVDLRQNGGGDPAQIQLISTYLFEEPVHLNDLYARATDRTENYWTLPYVPGARAARADVYVLTSARTFSGAEEFSYNLQNLTRATIVGETTGGGAHPTDAMIVQRDFILRVPFARAINPVSKTNWEGTGVKPDVAVPAAEAFDKAYAMAVEKLAAKAATPERKAEYEWSLAGLAAKRNPVRLDPNVLKTYAGEYGERKVSFENGQLFYQRTGPKYRLVPMTAALFAVEGLDYFRVEFTFKDGKVAGLWGLYDNGDRQPSPRTK